MLSRIIKKLYPDEINPRKTENLTFTDILNVPNIVLLGEPGAGKTYLFENASKHENGMYCKARTFSIYSDNTYTNQVVYIDALDEKRSKGEQEDSIAELIKKIREYKPSKLRISCRAADWLGETDLELFKPYFEANGGYCVVVLEALTEDEINQILTERQVTDPNSLTGKPLV